MDHTYPDAQSMSPRMAPLLSCKTAFSPMHPYSPCVAGVVYRVKDSSIVIAVDEAPEEGLEQPLRLEKLANEVRMGRHELGRGLGGV